ncbi:rRNA maturation RNase YbeY [Agrobacterium vitis]|uniref:Endoribonuclease YbeY n=1 Tax=Agrobacterium vitis TaxID=373 RepID=A0AAE2RFH2_AGRVI|nr:rRNA maturation RNase YbeY [Agrobacterium vitis]MBF2717351.1 rRNA maturation RNase YbeY [Agrobacterium vitis]MUZ61184.1 rRNA maturation RNase YbeY [Agrobacterium vitis]MVA20069.1 rRNA maturation RNase YbeY [Agrobacterium vitis]
MKKLDVQIAIETDGWPDEAELEALSTRILDHAADFIAAEGQPFASMPAEVSLVFTGDTEIQAINSEWRGQDKPTNVLSFPAYPIEPGDKPGPMLGDIVIARQTVEREAAELEKTITDHLTHLMVHGFLHLFGYDHMTEDEAEEMEGLETRILAGLGLSDPYAGQVPV